MNGRINDTDFTDFHTVAENSVKINRVLIRIFCLLSLKGKRLMLNIVRHNLQNITKFIEKHRHGSNLAEKCNGKFFLFDTIIVFVKTCYNSADFKNTKAKSKGSIALNLAKLGRND